MLLGATPPNLLFLSSLLARYHASQNIAVSRDITHCTIVRIAQITAEADLWAVTEATTERPNQFVPSRLYKRSSNSVMYSINRINGRN